MDQHLHAENAKRTDTNLLWYIISFMLFTNVCSFCFIFQYSNNFTYVFTFKPVYLLYSNKHFISLYSSLNMNSSWDSLSISNPYLGLRYFLYLLVTPLWYYKTKIFLKLLMSLKLFLRDATLKIWRRSISLWYHSMEKIFMKYWSSRTKTLVLRCHEK